MAKLIIRDGQAPERIHELTDDVTTFGRSSANIVQLQDEESSRQHFRIEKAGDGYRLVDLGSRNGTRVNGNKVSGQTLRPGDAITVGACKIIFDQKVEVSAQELGATVEVTPQEQAAVAAPAPAPAAVPAASAAPGAPPVLSGFPPPPAPQFILEVTEGPGTGTKVELGVDPVTMGRNRANKLMVDDEAASNYHAEVTKEAIGYVVSDLGSTNGTKVNGEKIVKSPLAHGARIQIGSTVITFKNLGAPTEEDAVFGTVVLDSDRIDKELAAARKGGGAGRVLAALLVVALVGVGGYYAARAIVHGGNGNGKPEPPVIGEVRNASFREGTDAEGSPKEWQAFSTHQRNRAMVDGDEGRETGKENDPRFSLRMQRAGEAKANSLTACQQAGAFAVDKGAAYRAAAYVRCPAALGLYGLRLTWVGAGSLPRELDQYATISGAHPQWKEVVLETLPPKWAARLRLSLVAFGNTGDVWFDDVSLQKLPAGDVAAAEESVDFKGVSAALDRAGRLSLERAGLPALTATLAAEGQGGLATDQNTARAEPGYPRSEGERRLFRGSIYDFSRNRPFSYEVSAGKGGEGVALSYAFSTGGEELTLDSLSLRLALEPQFAGAPEVYTAEGRKALPRGTAEGVTELILAAGGKDLVLGFDPPVAVTVVPAGERKDLVVQLAKSPSLNAAPRRFAVEFGTVSARAAAERVADFAAVNRLFDDKNWKAFPGEAAKVRGKHPGAAAELTRLAALEKEFARLGDEARRRADQAVRLAQEAQSAEAHAVAYDQGKKALEALQTEWAGTELEAHISANKVKLEETVKIREGAKLEAEAKGWLEKAKAPMKDKQWALAKVYLDKVIKDYAASQAARDARKLLDVVESSMKREEAIDEAQKALLRKVKNFELNSQFKAAVDLIEKDENYRKFGTEMPEVQKKLEELKAKVQ